MARTQDSVCRIRSGAAAQSAPGRCRTIRSGGSTPQSVPRRRHTICFSGSAGQRASGPAGSSTQPLRSAPALRRGSPLRCSAPGLKQPTLADFSHPAATSEASDLLAASAHPAIQSGPSTACAARLGRGRDTSDDATAPSRGPSALGMMVIAARALLFLAARTLISFSEDRLPRTLPDRP